MNNLSTDPRELEDAAIQKEIARLQGIGDLQMDDWTKGARPAKGWTFEAFEDALQTRRAPVPQYAGANPSAMLQGGWFDQTKALIDKEEGYEARAYHGVLSSARRKQGDIYVQPGHQSSEEVAIGYGWNMQRKDTKQVWQSQLGMTGPEVDDVFNGRKQINRVQAEKLRDYAIMEMNNGIERDTKDHPLRDHQRAALVSIAYNMGYGGLKKTGIMDALKAGKQPDEIAKMILAIPSNKERRKAEAAQFLGADAMRFFAMK
jgi:GH24 family phage-related lysozyme (muramidase)